MRGGMRERTPGVWELRIELGRDPVTGRRRQLSRTVHGGRREAERALNKLVSDSAQTIDGTDARLTELMHRWLDLVAADLSPTTLRRYRGLMRRQIEPAMGDRKISRIRPAELDAFYLALVRDAGLAPATVRQVHAVIRRALSQAVRWGWIASNPASKTSPPRVRRPGVTPPTVQQVQQLLDLVDIDDSSFACLLRVAAATGARRGEVCALRWADIDLDHGTITIRRSIAEVAGGLIEKATKTHSARRIALDAGTARLLAAHLQRTADAAAEVGVTMHADRYVFSSTIEGSRPISPDTVTKRFISYRRRAGLGTFRLHDLRHFAATRLLAAGVPVRTVAGRLGHANAATTLGVYAHFLAEGDRVAADVLGDMLDARDRASA